MAENSTVNPVVAELFKLGQAFAVPLANKLLGSPEKSGTPKELNATFSERIYNNSLNGSGPSDPRVAAESSPRTMMDQITGAVSGGNGNVAQQSNQMPMMLIAAVAALAVVVLMMRR